MKFEFGDLYRFIVSLGIFLISSAFVFPWLFLKEKLDLNNGISCITENIDCDVLSIKKEILYWILKSIPFFSIVFFLLGIVVVIYGLVKWRKNQLLLDEQIRIEHDLKQASVRVSTEDEIIDKLEKEIIESEPEIDSLNVLARKINVWESMEDKVAEKLVNTNVGKGLERNILIANHEIDFVIKRGYFKKDCIVELKYIRKGFNFGWLKEVFLKHLYKKSLYTQFRGRSVGTLLLVLVDDKVFNKEKYEELQTRLINSGLGSGVDDKVKIYPVSQFMKIDSDRMESALFS
ncbi:hypothetical protein KC248_16445 [Klebsiella michiganensis]|uniref:hypothetical protein n=1 Tax=Klebsiella michiganensis TaxID=1134687 RepID=UPI001B812701|nr:hypothetical protein [Klebsiella michiganensis]ELD3251389.1 hypothetical protein [Enterobacter hormaechei]MBR7530115.1 hypothetical protein [Klebsiella michiganensis]MBR7572324.1 hypothetical protein [Klebsiella michiganensis]HEO1675507.1 hypothetical protein [Klebsiella aerogenes]